jgi:hypothetical protein
MKETTGLGRVLILLVALLIPQAISPVWAADEVAPNHRPVKEIADSRIAVGDLGMLPLYLSADWSKPLPDIDRAVLILHGRLRDAEVYFRSARTAQAAAGDAGKAAIMIVPQSSPASMSRPINCRPTRCDGVSKAGRAAIPRSALHRSVRSTRLTRLLLNWPTERHSRT